MSQQTKWRTTETHSITKQLRYPHRRLRFDFELNHQLQTEQRYIANSQDMLQHSIRENRTTTYRKGSVRLPGKPIVRELHPREHGMPERYSSAVYMQLGDLILNNTAFRQERH
jgi:hypothetical protein